MQRVENVRLMIVVQKKQMPRVEKKILWTYTYIQVQAGSSITLKICIHISETGKKIKGKFWLMVRLSGG